jgi:hypothetical protein
MPNLEKGFPRGLVIVVRRLLLPQPEAFFNLLPLLAQDTNLALRARARHRG